MEETVEIGVGGEVGTQGACCVAVRGTTDKRTHTSITAGGGGETGAWMGHLIEVRRRSSSVRPVRSEAQRRAPANIEG